MIMAKLGIIQDEEDNFRFVLKKLKMNFTEGKFALIGMILPGHIDVELMATVVLDMLIITFCERMQIWSNSSSSSTRQSFTKRNQQKDFDIAKREIF